MRKLIGAASCWVVLDDVAKAPHCLDNWAAIWEWLLEFAPEIVDKNLDIIWQDISIEVPNVSHDVILAEDLILIAQEVLEDGKFFSRERNRLASSRHGLLDGIKLDISHAQHGPERLLGTP